MGNKYDIFDIILSCIFFLLWAMWAFLKRAHIIKMIWRFPEMGVPPFIIHVHRNFHILNHPAIGGTTIYGNPHINDGDVDVPNLVFFFPLW